MTVLPVIAPRSAFTVNSRELTRTAEHVSAISTSTRWPALREGSPLGTDGFGPSDTRGALRRHFRVDAPSIVLRVLTQLADRAEIDESAPSKAIALYRLNEIDAATPGSTGGPAE